MVDNAALVLQLREIFLVEIKEHAQTLEAETMRLETELDREKPSIIQSIFRTFHSLKGSARVVGFQQIESLCHHLEDLLGDIRNGTVEIGPQIVEVLLEAVDILVDAENILKDHSEHEDDRIAQVCARSDNIRSGQSIGETPSDSSPKCPAQTDKPENSKSSEDLEIRPSHPKQLLHQQGQAANDAGMEKQNCEESRAEREGPSLAPAPVPRVATGASDERRPEESTSRYLRVESEKLDRLIEKSSELLIASRRMENFHSLLTDSLELISYWRRRTIGATAQIACSSEISNALDKIHQQVGQLSESFVSYEHSLVQGSLEIDVGIRGLRMLAFRQVAGLLQRAARDTAKKCGKIVEFRLSGEDVELDRSVLERLKDPLVHIVRNAVDHGIEEPKIRSESGKRPYGNLHVSVSLCGDRVDIEVRDDGKGIDLEKLVQKASERGIEIPRDRDQQLDLIFHPGLSTANQISAISGRGIGMEVVRAEVEAVGGSVVMQSIDGQGCRMTLRVPLTLTVTTALVFESGSVTFAIPSANVLRLQRISRDSIRTVAGVDLAESIHGQLALVTLDDVLNLPPAKPHLSQSKVVVVTLVLGDRVLGVCVDCAIDEREVVVKALGSHVGKIPGISGGTIMPNGSVALILSGEEIVRIATQKAGGTRTSLGRSDSEKQDEKAKAKKRLLVVDDSVTIRSMQKAVLEANGYEVVLSSDGDEAWKNLQRTNIDLVISDIDMPVMDGFALTRALRGSKRYANTPIILVTGRDSENDRQQGADAGADAYLVKKEFDNKRLLDVVRRHL